jgi:hypothetical protein
MFQLQTDKNPFQFHIIFIGMNPIKRGPGQLAPNVGVLLLQANHPHVRGES